MGKLCYNFYQTEIMTVKRRMIYENRNYRGNAGRGGIPDLFYGECKKEDKSLHGFL